MATMQMSYDNQLHTVIGIYRPKPGSSSDEVLEATIKHYGSVEEISEFQIAAIVKSLDNAYAGSYAHWKQGTDITAVFHLPGLATMLTDMGAIADIEPVEAEVIPSPGLQPPILSKGDILHMALLSTDPENQQKLIEYLQAKAKFQGEAIDGLKSVTVHRSLDGKKVVVVGVWRDREAAEAAITSPSWVESGRSLDEYVTGKEMKLFEIVLVR